MTFEATCKVSNSFSNIATNFLNDDTLVIVGFSKFHSLIARGNNECFKSICVERIFG